MWKSAAPIACQRSSTVLCPGAGGDAPPGPPVPPGSFLGFHQQDPSPRQVPVSPQGTTYLQELDAVARSPDGERQVGAGAGVSVPPRGRGRPGGPSPPAPAQTRDRGDLIPGGESWTLWGGWVLTFFFNSKGPPSTRGVRNHRSSPGPTAAPSLPGLPPHESSRRARPTPLTGTHLVPPLPCR